MVAISERTSCEISAQILLVGFTILGWGKWCVRQTILLSNALSYKQCFVKAFGRHFRKSFQKVIEREGPGVDATQSSLDVWQAVKVASWVLTFGKVPTQAVNEAVFTGFNTCRWNPSVRGGDHTCPQKFVKFRKRNCGECANCVTNPISFDQKY